MHLQLEQQLAHQLVCLYALRYYQLYYNTPIPHRHYFDNVSECDYTTFTFSRTGGYHQLKCNVPPVVNKNFQLSNLKSNEHIK